MTTAAHIKQPWPDHAIVRLIELNHNDTPIERKKEIVNEHMDSHLQSYVHVTNIILRGKFDPKDQS